MGTCVGAVCTDALERVVSTFIGRLGCWASVRYGWVVSVFIRFGGVVSVCIGWLGWFSPFMNGNGWVVSACTHRLGLVESIHA